MTRYTSCIAGERPINGSCSSISSSGPLTDGSGAVKARSTTLTSSRRSNGLGKYSKAPRSVALTAVIKVFCALITMMRRSGRSFLMRGTRSRPFSSGITTSVMTRSPSPFSTQRHKVAALPVVRTSWPSRANAWLSTVRIARSSSATRIVFPAMSRIVRRRVDGQHDPEDGAARQALELDHAAMLADQLGDQRQAEPGAVGLAGNERVEQMRPQILGNAGTVVLDRD